MTTYSTHFDSPVGTLLALAKRMNGTHGGEAITTLHMLGAKHEPLQNEAWIDTPTLPVFLQVPISLSAVPLHAMTTSTASSHCSA